MAIVKMKRLRVITPFRLQRKVVKDLTRLGCVEIETPAYANLNEDVSMLVKPLSIGQEASRNRTEMIAALDALNKYAPEKKSFLAPRRQVTESVLFDEESIKEAIQTSEQINGLIKQIAETKTLIGRICAQKATLNPWTASDIPLDFTGGESFSVILGVCAAENDVKEMTTALEEQNIAAVADVVYADREQSYIVLVSYKDAQEDALTVLKAAGFSQVTFKDLTGTAAENLSRLDEELTTAEKNVTVFEEKITQLAPMRNLVEQTADALAIEALRETAMSSMLQTEKTIYFEGWVPQETEALVSETLVQNGCAYEFVEAQEDQEPPIVMKSKNIFAPYTAVSELYGYPHYRSLIDFTPFLAVSFFVFFGMMLSDAGYGLVLALISFIVLKKKKPTGTFKQFMTLGLYGGISAFIWGAFFGSWFGNFATAIGEMLGQSWSIGPVLFDPLKDPITMLMLSLGCGVVHLLIGMGLSAYRMIKQGNVKDAIFDIGFWYMIILGALGMITGLKIFMYIALLGALGVLVTAGRAKKNIFSKITSGLGALYGITGYLSDILSYSRLMALGLATGVVATVMNTMGSLAGKNVAGWILFIVVFIIGQTFNLAISLLGAFIHTVRLEFVEFFGKFYEGGGRKFKPLFNETKYIQVIKEEI